MKATDFYGDSITQNLPGYETLIYLETDVNSYVTKIKIRLGIRIIFLYEKQGTLTYNVKIPF